MRSGTIVFGAILLLVARPAASGAQDLRTILEAQLDAAAPTIVGGGYVPDPAAIDTEMIVGLLRDQQSVGLELRLRPGREYMVLGVCDQDCDDLDLSLSQMGGALVADDSGTDDVPILDFVAPADGRAILFIRMVSCDTNPCAFGYRVYRR